MSKFSQSSAFKWSAEDLVSNADRALMNGNIDGDEYRKIRIMSDEDKLIYLESIVEQFEEHLMEYINNEIYSAIVYNFNESKRKSLTNPT